MQAKVRLQTQLYEQKHLLVEVVLLVNWSKVGCFKSRQTVFFTQCRLHVFLAVVFAIHANCRKEACLGRRHFMSACFHVSGVCVLVQQQLWLCWTWPSRAEQQAGSVWSLSGCCNHQSLVGEKTCITAAGALWKLSLVIQYILSLKSLGGLWCTIKTPHTVTEGEPLVNHHKMCIPGGAMSVTTWAVQSTARPGPESLEQAGGGNASERSGLGAQGAAQSSCHPHPLTAAGELWLQDVLMGGLGGLPRSLYPEERLSQERLFDCQIISCWLWHMTSTPHF